MPDIWGRPALAIKTAPRWTPVSIRRWLSDQLRSRGRRRGIGCGTEIAGSVGVFLEEIKMALGGFEELLIEESQKADPKRTGFPNWLLGRDSNPRPSG